MFWDRVAALYDLFEGIYNGKVYRETGEAVAGEIEPGDVVLECACGTGAIRELIRVCKPGGKVILPTYINMAQGRTGKMAKLLGRAGANFQRQFDRESYRAFIRDMGYEDVSYRVIDGRMPCMIAVIRK